MLKELAHIHFAGFQGTLISGQQVVQRNRGQAPKALALAVGGVLKPLGTGIRLGRAQIGLHLVTPGLGGGALVVGAQLGQFIGRHQQTRVRVLELGFDLPNLLGGRILTRDRFGGLNKGRSEGEGDERDRQRAGATAQDSWATHI